MAVYTKLTSFSLGDFWREYNLGYLLEYQEIINGISNSNYLIHSTQGEYILTMFESLNSRDVLELVNLLDNLSASYPLSPVPLKDVHNAKVRYLENKPAIVCPKLTGKSVNIPNTWHCFQLGLHLASIHSLLKNYRLPINSDNSLPSLQHSFTQVRSQLNIDDIKLIEDELYFQQSLNFENLPRGLIHGDLFRDNVLFNNLELTGIVDFNSASNDYLICDIAVAINDWCQIDNVFILENMSRLLFAYNLKRPLTQPEKAHLPHMLRHCALRFWLSRVKHNLNCQYIVGASPTNPEIFKQMLIQYRNTNHLHLCELIDEAIEPLTV